MNKEKGFLVGLAVLGLALVTPRAASSWEMPPAKLESPRGRAFDVALLKAAYERRKSAILQSTAAEAGAGAVPVAGGLSGPGRATGPQLPAENEAEAALVSESPDKVAAALQYDPVRVYRFLVAYPTVPLSQAEAVLDEVRAQVDRSAIPPVAKEVKASALRAMGVSLRARADTGTVPRSQVGATALENATPGGLE